MTGEIRRRISLPLSTRLSRVLRSGLAIALLAAVGCEPSTGLDCDPAVDLDCGGFGIGRPTHALVVEVAAEDGTALPGAAVRLELLYDCCYGIWFADTTDAQGRVRFYLGYGEHSPPQPIELFVSPPSGSPLSAIAVTDTIVFLKRNSSSVLPIVLTQLGPN